MNDSIRSKVKLFGICLVRLFENRNDINYLEMVSMRNKHLLFKRENLGIKYNKHGTFYIISYDWKTNGFFAIMRRVLAGCAVSDSMGFTPYIQIIDSIYNVPGGYEGTNNMFEYYFEQPSTIPYEDIVKNENYILSESVHYRSIYYEFGLSTTIYNYKSYNVNEDLLRYFGKIYAKYFKIKKPLEDEFQIEIENVLKKHKVIGVHYRGTDYRAGKGDHPAEVDLKEYFDAIDQALTLGFEKIFLATDDSNILKQFIDKYGTQICYFDDVERGYSDYGVHFQKHNRDNDQFYLGREVLRDMCTLSSCSGLVAGLSQVSFFARIKKYAGGTDFEYKVIIDNGLNEKDSIKSKKYYSSIKINNIK